MLKNDANLSKKSQTKVKRLSLHLKKIASSVAILALLSMANQALAQTAQPTTPLEADFTVETNSNQIIARWVSSPSTSFSDYIFSVDDENGVEVFPPVAIDESESSYRSAKNLNLGQNYILKISASLKAQGTTTNSDALEIPVTIKQTLPAPTETQVRFGATANSITVYFRNALEEVTNYDVRLSAFNSTSQIYTSVSERTAAVQTDNSLTFSSLTGNNFHRIEIQARGNSDRYNISPFYQYDIATDSANQLERPLPTLSITDTGERLVTWEPTNNATTYEITIFQRNVRITPRKNVTRTTERFPESLIVAGTLYRIEIIAKANGFTNSATGIAFIRIPIVYLGTVAQPTGLMTALLSDARGAEISWDIVPNADSYLLSVYDDKGPYLERLQSMNSPTTRTTSIKNTIIHSPGVRQQVGIIAERQNYRPSAEVFIDLTAAIPPINTFMLNRSNNNVSVTWDRSNEFDRIHSASNFVFSITDSNGQNVIAERAVSATSSMYESNNTLSENTAYTLNAFSRIQIGGENVDSPVASVPFRTKVTLPAPTPEQITLNAKPDSVEIIRNTPPPTGASEYIISISSRQVPDVILRMSDATIEGSETFSLNREFVYEVSIISSGDSSLYVKSAPYIIPLALNRGDEIPPVIALNTNVQSAHISKTSTTLIWEAATDLAGSIRDINNDSVDRTRPNNNNINYEIIVEDITLGVANSTPQVIPNAAAVMMPPENTLNFIFNPNLELGHVYSVSIVAIDNAGLRSNGTYTGTFPSGSLPIISDENITIQERTGTSVLLNWSNATETVGSGTSVEGSNTNLRYELTIEDVSADVANLQTATIMQTVMTGVLRPEFGSVSFILDRGNSVLIPGREYKITITPFNSLMQKSAGTYAPKIFSMALTMDVNSDGIEDSLVGITTGYCGGIDSTLSGDSDNDGILNGIELASGTDCRPTNIANFNDTDLRLVGLSAPTAEQITINATPDFVEIMYASLMNAPTVGNTEYVIRIDPSPETGTDVRRVSATMDGTEAFTLDRDKTYRIFVVTVNNLYLSSSTQTSSLALDRGDEILPVISSNTNVGSEITSRTSTTLIWEAATDLAGSVIDGNGNEVDRTRPNSHNISYEIAVIEITLGVTNSGRQVVSTASTAVMNPPENTLAFTFDSNLELGRVYRSSITATDDAGLKSIGTYTGTFPPVTLPVILDEEVTIQERAGTRVTLNWRGAYEVIGENSEIEGSNGNLIYELTIADMSLDVSPFQNATTIQTVMTRVLRPQNDAVVFTLDRSNSVLIPGREYEITITAFNSLMQKSSNTYTTGRFNMALTMDVDSDGIEDSLSGITGIRAGNIDNYCGGGSDSDNDGISNRLEIETGTDCRPASTANKYFYDNGLRLNGLVAPTADQITIDAKPDIAVVAYTPLPNAPSAGDTQYAISITPAPETSTRLRIVSATTTETETFILDRDRIYEISVRTINNLYLDSTSYTSRLELNRGDEILPIISSNTNVEGLVTIEEDNSISVSLIWEAATDLAGSVIDGNGNEVDRTRPNSHNINYELTITDITLGVANPITQTIVTGVLNPLEEDSTVVLFAFKPIFEFARVYRVSIVAVDNAGLEAIGTYTGTYPPVSRPIILDESINAENRTGTSVTLRWRNAFETIGSGPIENNNNNLHYELTIEDISFNIPELQTATVIQEFTPGVLRPQNNMVSFLLNRNNSVLIPGRDYMARIIAFNSLMERSTRTYARMFTMAESTDANNDGIEDSLNGINGITNINNYCGTNPDADDDGISNLREVETGTDCRPASIANENFEDNGLTLNGVVAPMVTVYRIGNDDFDSIADRYTAARPVPVIGLTALENNGLAMTTCSDCTVTPLLVVANAGSCTRLSDSLTGDSSVVDTDIVIDTADGYRYIGNVLCQVRDSESVYLPLGFSTIVWKVEDLSGNIIQDKQLYYVAPEVSISPAQAYVQRNIDGTLSDAMVDLNINAGEISSSANRYDLGFDGTAIEGLSTAKFLLNDNSGISLIPVSARVNPSRGVVTMAYRYSIGADLETATLILDTAEVISIDALPENYSIDRNRPVTYAYKIGNTTQALTVIDRPIEAQVNSRLEVTASESKIVISVTTPTDTRGIHTISAEVLYKVDGSERVMPLIAQNNGNTTTFDLILITEAILETSTDRAINEIAASESSATRIYITSNENGDVVWERYCAYHSNGFCNTPEFISYSEAYQTNTSPARTATVALSSNTPFRTDGRYASRLVPDKNTDPVEAAADAVDYFGGVYSGFPVIEFNADTINSGQLTPMIALVIKLPESIPSAGGYLYKYIDRTLGSQNNPRWRAFFEGEGHGRLYSAPEDSNRNCPAIVLPDDAAAGLTRADGTWGNLIDTNTHQVLWYRTATMQTLTNEGVMEERLTFNTEVSNSRCVLVWLTDGGRNDADVVVSNEIPNGIISDPILLGAPALPPRPCPGLDSVCSDTASGNGGAVSKRLLFLLMLVAGAALIQRRKKLINSL